MAETRPVRMCDACGGVDDHPRHVHGVGPGDSPTSPEIAKTALLNAKEEDKALIIEQIFDQTTQVRHMDCCRAAGCPDGTCNLVTAGAEDKRGNALVKHLTSLTPQEG